jgi:hypothetical protein
MLDNAWRAGGRICYDIGLTEAEVIDRRIVKSTYGTGATMTFSPRVADDVRLREEWALQ